MDSLNSEIILPRNSTFKREQLNNTKSQFLQSYTPDEKYSFNNFVIHYDQQIGSGAFSNVYKSTNTIDNKVYAVKVVQKDTLQDITVDVIYNEIKIHERIIHPNIIRMYNHYEDDKNIFCFLEIVNGITLYSKVKGGLSEREAFQLFIQVAKSIKFCHDNKIIHRDIKLENFLLDPQTNILKLCDFGWAAELTEEQPLRATICGTTDYMAPEMIKEKAYDYSVDIWAMGILLYELLHGYSPFGNSDDYTEVFKNVLKFNFHIDKEITNNCKDLLLKLLGSEPEKRIKVDGVMSHPWMKDWVEEKKEEKVVDKEDDKMFYDILSKVEKKNKTKKGKKKDGDGHKKKVTYRKNKDVIVKAEPKKEIEPEVMMASTSASDNIKKIVKEEKLPEEVISTSKKPIQIEKKKFKQEEEPVIVESKENILDDIEIQKESNNFNNNADDLLNMLSKDERNKNKEEEEEFEINTDFHPKSKKKYINEEIEQPQFEPFYKPKQNIYDNNTKSKNTYIKRETDELQSTLKMFDKAEKLKEQNSKKVVKEEEGFWSKLFSPFKCNNN